MSDLPKGLDTDSPRAAPAALGTVWAEYRIPLMAALTAKLGDLDRAEDALSEAVLRAHKSWAVALPDNPSGWLYRVALNAARDQFRKTARHRDQKSALEETIMSHNHEDPDVSSEVRLALFQKCADPSLSQDQQIAVMLFHLGGLSCKAIAKAFLVEDTVIYQRLSRARTKLKGQPFVPDVADSIPMVRAALEVIYLQSYRNLSGGPEADALGQDALNLGEALCEASPKDAENWALLALLYLLQSRASARISDMGAMIPLGGQDPSKWMPDDMARAAKSLKRSLSLTTQFGPYGVRAHIEMTRMRALRDGECRDQELLELHDLWLELTHQPFAAIERALILARVKGPKEAIKALDSLLLKHDLSGHAGWHLAKAEMHEQLGQIAETRFHLNAALSRIDGETERGFVESKIEELLG